jgi:glycogen operon protein
MINAGGKPLEFEVPSAEGAAWRRWIDTSLPSPQDILDFAESPEVSARMLRVEARSIVFLIDALPS